MPVDAVTNVKRGAINDATLRQSLAMLDDQFASLESLNTWAAAAGSSGGAQLATELPPLPQIEVNSSAPSSPLKDKFKSIEKAPRILSMVSELDFGNDLLWDALGLEKEDLESEENHSGDRLENIGKTMSANSLSPTPTTNDLFNMADFPSFSSVSEISSNSKDTNEEDDTRRSKAISSFPLPPAVRPISAEIKPSTDEQVEDAEEEDVKEAQVVEMVRTESKGSITGLGITTEPETVAPLQPPTSVPALSPTGSGFGSHTSSMSMDSIEALADDEQAVVAQPRGRPERPRLVSPSVRAERVPSFIGSVGVLEPPSPVSARFSSPRLSTASIPASPIQTGFPAPPRSPNRRDVWGADVARLSLTESGIPQWDAQLLSKAPSDDYYLKRMSALNDKMEKLKKKKSEPALRSISANVSTASLPLAKKKSEPALRSSVASSLASGPADRPMPLRKMSAPAATTTTRAAPPKSPLMKEMAKAPVPNETPELRRRSSRFSLNLRFGNKKSPSATTAKSPPLPTTSSKSPAPVSSKSPVLPAEPQTPKAAPAKSIKKKASLSSLASKASARFAPRSPSFRSHKDSIALKSPALIPSMPSSPLPSPGLSGLPSPALSESSFRPQASTPTTPAHSPNLERESVSVDAPAEEQLDDIDADADADAKDSALELQKTESINTSRFVEQMDSEPPSRPATIVQTTEDEIDSRGPSMSIDTEGRSSHEDGGSISSVEAHVMTAAKVVSPILAACPLPPVTSSYESFAPPMSLGSPAVQAVAVEAVAAEAVAAEAVEAVEDPVERVEEEQGETVESLELPPSPLSPTFANALVSRPRRSSSILPISDIKSQIAAAISHVDKSHAGGLECLSPESLDMHSSAFDAEQEEIIAFPAKLEAPRMSRQNSTADSSMRSELNGSTQTYDSQSSTGHGDESPDATSIDESSDDSHASFKDSVEGPEVNDTIDFTTNAADDEEPLAKSIPNAIAVQQDLLEHLEDSKIAGQGEKNPFEFSEVLTRAHSTRKQGERPATPEPIGHSMLPQTDDAVERKRAGSLVSSPSQPLDPAIAESTLMLSDSPPVERIPLGPKPSQELRSSPRAGSPDKKSTRAKPALTVDVHAPVSSWTSAAPTSASSLLSPPLPSASLRAPSSPRHSASPSQRTGDASRPRLTSRANSSATTSTSRTRSQSPEASRSRAHSFRSTTTNTDEKPRKVYIVDSKTHFMPHVGSKTRCGDVVEMARAQGLLNKGSDADGGWALWEACVDAGMERPCREYEILSDVMASWGEEKNIIIIRRTLLYPLLSACLRPQPLMPKGEQAYVELKKGKWVKRYLKVDEGAVYHSKSERGKDAVLLCKLSRFDAYFVAPRLAAGAPRPGVFALKSSLRRNQFEDESQHCYSIAVKSAEDVTSWIRAIIEARNEFLREREVEVLGQSSLPRQNSKASKPLFSPVLPPSAATSPVVSSRPAPQPHPYAGPSKSTSRPGPPTMPLPPIKAAVPASAPSGRAPVPPGLGPVESLAVVRGGAHAPHAMTTRSSSRTRSPDIRQFAPTAGAALRLQQQHQGRTLLDQREEELRIRTQHASVMNGRMR